MKNLLKTLLGIFTFFAIFMPSVSQASSIEGLDDVMGSKNLIEWGSESLSETVEVVWKRFLSTVKNIFSWVMLILIVYAWAQMIISQWDDEQMLSKSKRMIWYSMIGIFFINMPWTIFEAIKWDRTSVSWWIGTTWSNDIQNWVANLFINADVFSATINNTVVRFIKVVLVWLSVMIIILSWMKIIWSRWNQNALKEWKQKIAWALIALVFVWFIEAWQRFAYTWKISDWVDIFKTIANLALFLAVPVAVFFLSLAWYYYIISAWDQEKVKKAKNIIVNTLIWTVILLVSLAFLYDLIQI